MTQEAGRARRCTALRVNGKPCQGWAQRDSDPPRCVTHAGSGEAPSAGREPGEAEPISIASIIADLASKQRAISEYLDRHLTPEATDLDEIANLFALHGLNASRLGRLLRDQRALSGAASDGIAGAIAQALDELSTELGADL